MRKHVPHSRHHLLARSRKGSNAKENIIYLKDHVHKAFHTIFANDTIPEQIERLLELNINCLQGDFVEDIRKVLELYKEDVYHGGIRKGK